MSTTNEERRYLQRLGAKVESIRIDKLGTRSKSKLAEIAGITPQMLGMVERGETNPTIAMVLRIAGGLEVELGDLLP